MTFLIEILSISILELLSISPLEVSIIPEPKGRGPSGRGFGKEMPKGTGHRNVLSYTPTGSSHSRLFPESGSGFAH